VKENEQAAQLAESAKQSAKLMTEAVEKLIESVQTARESLPQLA